MELTKSSCEGFLESLASKAPVPGGGGAAALVGAAGVALGNMVGSLTVGKKKYAAVEADLRTLNARAEALRRRLETLVQADAEAFLPLAAAYGLPKETPEQQAHKAAVLEQALDGACAMPLEIMPAVRALRWRRSTPPRAARWPSPTPGVRRCSARLPYRLRA